MKLRPYQEDAIGALYDHLARRDDHPVIVVPTGGGKTPIMATICKEAVEGWHSRVLILAHRKELLTQTLEKIQAVWPLAPVGIYSAGLGKRDTRDPILLGGIQSVFRRAPELGRFDLVMIDEAHRIPPDGEGMYRELLGDLKTINPAVRLIGLTATPYRLGTGLICSPENLLNHVCYEVSVKTLIEDGYLCRLVSRSGKSDSIANLSQVHTRGGEYIESELEAAMSELAVVKAAVRDLLAAAGTRKKILIFTCGVAHAGIVEAALREAAPEERIASVFGDTIYEDRDETLRRFKDPADPLRFLINVNVLTEGFDATCIDLIALMRATKSPGLYYQMIGRGLRLHPGKQDCLVLDFGKNILRHGPIDQVRPGVVKDPDAEPGDAPMKVCPGCELVVPTAILECPDCGYKFPKKIVNHDHEADRNAEIHSGHEAPEWYRVLSVAYREHTKKGDTEGKLPRTLRVDYTCGEHLYSSKVFSEWVCVEHDGFAGDKARKWWAERTTEPFCPNAYEARLLADRGALRVPSEIRVKVGRGDTFTRIDAYRFEDQAHMREPGEDERDPFEQMCADMGITPGEVPF